MPAKAKTPAKPENRDAKIEKYLNDRGFTWVLHEGLPLDEFDQDKSLKNQARVGKPLDEATVRRYVDALENGDVFPPIIAAETSTNAPLVVADGNHRFEAHKRHVSKGIDTYIVQGATPQAVTILTFEANTKHGLPTNENDRIHQALWMMDTGVTAEEAARRLGLPVGKLRNAANLAAVDRRAEENHINRAAWDRLPDGTKKRLGQASTDEGFAALAKLTIDAGLNTSDVSPQVGQMNALRSSKKQVEFVDAARLTFAHQLQVGGSTEGPGFGRQVNSGRKLFGMALGQLAALPSADSITERMGDDEKPEFLRRTEEAIGVLERIRDALKS